MLKSRRMKMATHPCLILLVDSVFVQWQCPEWLSHRRRRRLKAAAAAMKMESSWWKKMGFGEREKGQEGGFAESGHFWKWEVWRIYCNGWFWFGFGFGYGYGYGFGFKFNGGAKWSWGCHVAIALIVIVKILKTYGSLLSLCSFSDVNIIIFI